MRIDRSLIDPFDLSDRVCGPAAGDVKPWFEGRVPGWRWQQAKLPSTEQVHHSILGIEQIDARILRSIG